MRYCHVRPPFPHEELVFVDEREEPTEPRFELAKQWAAAMNRYPDAEKKMTAPIMLGGGPWGPEPPKEPPPPSKHEGVFKDAEQLAIMLACGASSARTRPELVALWNEKREGVREGYRLRAKRLLALWSDA